MDETQTWLNETYLSLVLEANIEYTKNTEIGVNTIQDLTERTKDKAINGVKIVDYEVKKAIDEGKNYASIIYKVQVRYTHKTDEIKKKSYIIKKLIPLSVEFFADKETETLKMLPKVEESIGCKFSPELYAYTQEEMVMEDLTELGFKNADLNLLDYEHCELAMKKLAKYHAGSVLLHRTYPKLVEEKIGADVLIDTKVDKIVFFENILNKMGDELVTIPGSEEYAPVLKCVARTVREYIKDMNKTNRMRVLNHGDFWLNNVMFKYDAEKVCDILFVDFQVCRFAPPTCDIMYFIGSSADLDVRQNRLDDLYSAYLKAFNDKLSDLGISPGMTMQQLYDNLQEDRHFLFIGFCPLLVLLAEVDKYFTLQDVSSEIINNISDRFGGLVKTRLFRRFMPAVLDDLNKKGVLQRFKE